MTISRLAKLTLLAAAPLALVACDDAATSEGGVASGEPLPAIAAPAGAKWADTVTVTPEGGYMIGNPDAPLKLVEYGSLTCPACARFAADGIEPLKDKYVGSGRVSFEFRSFLIHGPLDLTLTRLIGCSSPEAALPLADQIWANLGPIQDRAFANQAALGTTNGLPENERFVRYGEITGLYEFFAARGISEDQARTCLSDFASLERLAKLSEGYSSDGINQTPTFVLNGRKLDAGSWPQLEPLLQRAGAR